MIKDNWKVKLQGRNLPTLQIINRISQIRGIDAIPDFLCPGMNHINDPAKFKNIDIAAAIMISGIKNKKNFLIYADVDADGCTSAAIIYHYLKAFDIEPKLHINKGKAHGVQPDFDINNYGNIDIVVIVDSLNSTMAEYHKILKTGAEIIILDHHMPSQEILNNQKVLAYVSSANDYPNPSLTGSGVCWQFIRYVDNEFETGIYKQLADLASVGIIGDAGGVGIESMENRAICNMGFSNVANLGLYSLLKSDSMCSSDIGYTVAPLVNAANRMDDNWPALQLFTSNSSDEVKNVIKILEGHKTAQRAIVDKVFATFDELIEPQKDNLCYVFKVSNCRNLSGLLATKAVDKYGKPCLVVTESENTLDGSMRSTKTENFSAMINGTGLAQCDGHENSAGISIPKENLEELINRLNVELDGYEFTADISIDVQINRNQITPMLLDSIAEYNRITGNGFGEIRVLIDNIMDYSIRELSGGKHLSVEVPDMKFLKWNFNEWYNVLENSELSAIGTLSVNNFMGRKSVQMIMEDYNFSIPSTTNNLFF